MDENIFEKKEGYPDDFGKEYKCPVDGTVWVRIAKTTDLPFFCPTCGCTDRVLKDTQ